MNIFAHAGHDHAEELLRGTNSTLVVIAAICMVIAGVIVFAFVYVAVKKHRKKR